jgi:hypothetical protein
MSVASITSPTIATHEQVMMAFEEDVGKSNDLLLRCDPQLDQGKVAQVDNEIASTFSFIQPIWQAGLRLSSSVIAVWIPLAVLTCKRQYMKRITLILHIGDDNTARVAGRHRWM